MRKAAVRKASLGLISVGGVGLAVSAAAMVRRARAASAEADRVRIKTLCAEDGSRVRVFERGGVYQSATYTGARWAEPVFAYYRGFDALFRAVPSARRVLMLGGGGFAYPKWALTEHACLHMDVVELDPEVVAAARRWFYLDRLCEEAGPRLRIFTEDALAFLSRAAALLYREPYDAIINDCFDGELPVRALFTVDALTLAKQNLSENGVYLANIVSRDEGTDVAFLRDAAATALQVFEHVWILQTSDPEFGGEDNYLLIASDAAHTFSDAISFDEDFLGTPLVD